MRLPRLRGRSRWRAGASWADRVGWVEGGEQLGFGAGEAQGVAGPVELVVA